MLTHKQISFIKSGIRFIGCAALFTGGVAVAAVLLGVAEAVGVWEETGQNG